MENTIGIDVLPLGIFLGRWKKNHDTTMHKAEQERVYLYCCPGLFLCLECHFCFLLLICVSQLTSSTVVQNSAAPGFGKGEVHAGHSTEEAHRPLVGTVI